MSDPIDRIPSFLLRAKYREVAAERDAALALVGQLQGQLDAAQADRHRWRRVAEYGHHLHQYGENAPGGNETWVDLERLIRDAADREGKQ